MRKLSTNFSQFEKLSVNRLNNTQLLMVKGGGNNPPGPSDPGLPDPGPIPGPTGPGGS